MELGAGLTACLPAGLHLDSRPAACREPRACISSRGF